MGKGRAQNIIWVCTSSFSRPTFFMHFTRIVPALTIMQTCVSAWPLFSVFLSKLAMGMALFICQLDYHLSSRLQHLILIALLIYWLLIVKIWFIHSHCPRIKFTNNLVSMFIPNVCKSIYLFASCLVAHQALVERFHFSQSPNAVLTSDHDFHPASFLCFSTVRLQVSVSSFLFKCPGDCFVAVVVMVPS